MADLPRIQQPYPNVTVPPTKAGTSERGVEDINEGQVPVGLKKKKLSRTALILQGLRGAR